MEEEVFTFPKEYPSNPEQQMIARLAALQAGQSYTIQRVNRINGSIKELYGRTETNEKDLIRHAGECPLRNRVEEFNTFMAGAGHDASKIKDLNFEISGLNTKIVGLDKTIAEQLAEKAESARWKHMLQPIILGFGTAILTTILTLVMLHSSSFVKSETPPPPPPAATGVTK